MGRGEGIEQLRATAARLQGMVLPWGIGGDQERTKKRGVQGTSVAVWGGVCMVFRTNNH